MQDRFRGYVDDVGYTFGVCPELNPLHARLAFLKAGDHLLMVDTVYQPARQFCDGLLKGLGVETTYYDPLIGRGIAALIRPNTRVVYTESPGSQTMEVQDIPAMAEAVQVMARPMQMPAPRMTPTTLCALASSASPMM